MIRSVCVLALSLLIGIPASMARASELLDRGDWGTVDYLALGDSLPFGDNSFVPYTVEARIDSSIFVGFGDYVGRWGFAGRYRNLACPGETTGSFIDNRALSAGCIIYKEQIGLKTAYKVSQLDATLELIRKNPQMRLISLTIGGNDNFLLIKQCEEENPNDQEGLARCVQSRFQPLLDSIKKNLAFIFKSIRGAGFKGKLFLTNFYTKDYNDRAEVTSAIVGNLTYASTAIENQARPIDLFLPFGAAALWHQGIVCETGLLIKNVDGAEPACDVHYSDVGARLVAKIILDQSKF